MTQAPGTATINFQEPAASGKKHVCRMCSKAFKRGEHCIRHERGHTQEKPYGCEHCAKRFSRKDLLVRHQRMLHAVAKSQGKEFTVSQHPASPPQSPSHSSTENIDVLSSILDSEASRQSAVRHRPVAAGLESMVESTHGNIPAGQVQDLGQDPFLAEPLASQGDNMSQDDSTNMLSGMTSIFPDLIDPVFDWSSQQMADFALPPLDDQLTSGFSPLENYCSSSQGRRSSPQVAASVIISEHDPEFQRPQEVTLETSNHGGHAKNLHTRSASTIQVVKHKSTIAVIRFTEDMRYDLLEDLSTRISHETLQLLQPFGAVSFERCIQRYMDVFQTHVPLFHLPTFDIARSSSPLVLAVCMIGAIYRMDRRAAAIFYNLALQSLRQTDSTRDGQPSRIYLRDWIKLEPTSTDTVSPPLWESQTIFLLTIFETLSGDHELTSMAFERLGFFAGDFRCRLIWLQSHVASLDNVPWEFWIERESIKRLLYSYLYLCNLISMLFGITAGFSMLTDGKVEMPCHHALWDAPNAEQWRVVARGKGYSSPLILKDAVSRLLNGPYPKDIPEQHWTWDHYSCNVAVNAVSIYISHMIHGSHLLGEEDINAGGSSLQRSLITNQMETAISRCLLLIKHARARGDDSYSWDETEGPLLFNSLSLLRVSYCKIMTRSGSVCRTTFFRENETDFAVAIESFISEPLESDMLLARATAVALEGIMIPSKIGSRLVKKTAAFTWAIEHAFAGWDSILLLTKCLHVIEIRQCQGFPMHETEKQMVQKVSNLLAEEEGLMQSMPSSLAAMLARSWAEYYDDTWVWGVTPKMGKMLRQLADRYETQVAHVMVS